MKVKTSELTGRALAYAVGVAEGYSVETGYSHAIFVLSSGIPRLVPWNPHSNWDQGGPIIEREKINLIDKPFLEGTEHARNGTWLAYSYGCTMDQSCFGPTHLVAAMRYYVTRKLGDEVDIPDELL